MRSDKDLPLASRSDGIQRVDPKPGDGQRRAAVRLRAKVKAHPPLVQGPPSRQVLRWQHRRGIA